MSKPTLYLESKIDMWGEREEVRGEDGKVRSLLSFIYFYVVLLPSLPRLYVPSMVILCILINKEDKEKGNIEVFSYQ